MALGDLAYLRYKWQSGGVDWEMGFGFKALTASSTWRTTLAAEWNAQVHPTFAAALVTLASWLDTVVEDVVPGTGADVSDSVGSPGGGQIAGDTLPTQCAALISWRSALPGRANRGRTYISNFPLTSLDSLGQDWESAPFTRLRNIRNKILEIFSRTTGTSSTAFFVVISRQLDGVPRGPVGIQIDSGRVDGTVRTIRKRAYPG